MKTRILAFCLLLPIAIGIAFCLDSCSSGTKEKDNKANTVTADTSMSALTGVVEQNPPVVNGDYVAKYPSGIIKMKGYYIKGKREGQWISFFENGKMQSEGYFKNGLRDGKAVVYFENGQVYYTGYYKDGKEIGKWVFFDMTGKKVNEKDFDGSPSLRDKPNS